MKTYFQKQFKKVQRRFNWGLKKQVYSKSLSLFAKNGYQICYNKLTPQQYKPGKKNILFLIESPAVVEHHWDEWIQPHMEFHAEVSFHNFLKLPRYTCCRSLYATSDNFVELDPNATYTDKPLLVSMIYSDKQTLKGHKLRYEVAQLFGDKMDLLGFGATGKFIEKDESLIPYMYQVVIENGMYPDYVSEKFFDCLKTMTVPIYWGGREGVEKMGFDPRGILFFTTHDELEHILTKQISADKYAAMLPFVEKNYARLRELRQEISMDALLSPVLLNGYMGTTKSYYGFQPDKLSLDF